MGADPMALAIGMRSAVVAPEQPLQVFSVRKSPKSHGQLKLVEGNFSAGNHVAVLDDVVTRGESTLKAIDAVEQSGGHVDLVAMLVDREEGGRQKDHRARLPDGVGLWQKRGAGLEIVVTGATGFLGTALCGRLEREGHEVLRLNSKNCDLTRAESLEAFSQTAFDRIYHLAAWTQAGDFCLRHPGEQWLINQRINTHVLGCAGAAAAGQADCHGHELRLRPGGRTGRGELPDRPADREPVHLRHDQADALRRER